MTARGHSTRELGNSSAEVRRWSANGASSRLAKPLPTLEMVAAEAGVSRSTVSRVVNNSPKVRPDVVSSVNAAIARLNYSPNRAARSLASRQTYAIALMVPEDTTRFFGDPYFASIVKGITNELESSDYVLNLLVASSDPNRKTRRYLRGGNVDGAFVVSHHAGDQDLIELNQTMPVVFGGRPAVPDLGDGYYVDVDNIAGGRQATEYLLSRGYRRIGTITGPTDMPAAIDRLKGWRSVMQEHSLPDDAVVHGAFTSFSGATAMRELLDRHPDLEAVFVASDLMARGALATLADRGISVPGEVAVIGYDDSSAATSGELKLTTISQPSEEMGSRMATLLLEILAGHEPDHAVVLSTSLVVRDSA
ncbi:MAG: LacI family DNA-binding transcriptional regulator [Propionibacteriaceae bacterium]